MACLCAVMPYPVQRFSEKVASIAGSTDARWSVHNLALGVIGLVQKLDSTLLPVAAPGVTRLVRSCGLVMATTEGLLNIAYFLKAEAPLPELREDENLVKVVLPHEEHPIETAFRRDLREDPVKAISQLSVAWACFSASIALLETCKLDVIGAVAAGLGKLGIGGSVLLKAGFAVSGDIAYTSWCLIMMGRQMHHVYQGNNSRDDLIVLAATTTLFALEVLKLFSYSTGFALPVMGILAGSFGCCSFLIRDHKAKEALKEMNKLNKKAVEQLGVKV